MTLLAILSLILRGYARLSDQVARVSLQFVIGHGWPGDKEHKNLFQISFTPLDSDSIGVVGNLKCPNSRVKRRSRMKAASGSLGLTLACHFLHETEKHSP